MIHRPKEEGLETRRIGKFGEKSNWFRKKKIKEEYAREPTNKGRSQGSFGGSRYDEAPVVRTILFFGAVPKRRTC